MKFLDTKICIPFPLLRDRTKVSTERMNVGRIDVNKKFCRSVRMPHTIVQFNGRDILPLYSAKFEISFKLWITFSQSRFISERYEKINLLELPISRLRSVKLSGKVTIPFWKAFKYSLNIQSPDQIPLIRNERHLQGFFSSVIFEGILLV